MKMIASTKLAKAQRAMQAGKEYGLANSGEFLQLHPSRCIHPSTLRLPILNVISNSPTPLQRSSNTHPPKKLANANSSSSFPPTRVSAVVSTPPSQRQLARRFKTVKPMLTPLSWSSVTSPKLKFLASSAKISC